jgi:hypothetical protein
MFETCRICLEQEHLYNLVAPCKCSGTQRYVHPNCLEKWQRTMLDKLISSPETTSPDRVYRCVVCKAAYCVGSRNRLASWGSLLKRVIRSYILITMLGFLVVFFLIPLVMNLSGILGICIAVCYWKQVRPSIFLVSFSIDP